MSKQRSQKSRPSTKSGSVFVEFKIEDVEADKWTFKPPFEDPDGLPSLPFDTEGVEVSWLRPSEIWGTLEGVSSFTIAKSQDAVSSLAASPTPCDEPRKSRSRPGKVVKKEGKRIKNSKEPLDVDVPTRVPSLDLNAVPREEGSHPGPVTERPVTSFTKQTLSQDLPGFSASMPAFSLPCYDAVAGNGGDIDLQARGTSPACEPFKRHLPFLNWVASLFSAIGMHTTSAVDKGPVLWENLYPQDKEQRCVYNASGKYILRAYLAGSWRQVPFDDRLPVVDGQVLFLQTSDSRELWPMLCCKALCKLMTKFGVALGGAAALGTCMSWLTGYIPEDFIAECNDHTYRMVMDELRMGSLIVVSAEETSCGDGTASHLELGPLVYSVKKLQFSIVDDTSTAEVEKVAAPAEYTDTVHTFAITFQSLSDCIVELESLEHSNYDASHPKALKNDKAKEKVLEARRAAREAVLAAQKALDAGRSESAGPVAKGPSKERAASAKKKRNKRPLPIRMSLLEFCNKFGRVCIGRMGSQYSFELRPHRPTTLEGEDGDNAQRRQPMLLYYESEEPTPIVLSLSNSAGTRAGVAALSLYDWKNPASASSTLFARVSTTTVEGVRIMLPAGRLSCKLVWEAPLGSQIIVYSNVEILAGTFTAVHKAMDVFTTQVDGVRPPQAPSEWAVWFRARLTVEQIVTLVAQLHLDDPTAAPFVRLTLVDLDANTFESAVQLATLPRLLKPLPGSNATFVLVAECCAPMEVFKGVWQLSLLSDKSIPPPVCDYPRIVAQEVGRYIPNKYYLLFRFHVKCKEATACSIRLSTNQAGLTLRLRILDDVDTVVGADVEGKGPLVLPYMVFPRKDDEKKGNVALERKSGSAEKKGEKEKRNKLERAMSQRSIPESSLVRWTIQASIEPGSWPHPPLGVLATVPPSALGVDDSTASKRRKDKKDDRNERSGRKGKDKSNAKHKEKESAASAEDTLIWQLSVASDAPVDLIFDTEKEDKLTGIKNSWETRNPGRATKARTLRDSFLSKKTEDGHPGTQPSLAAHAPADGERFAHDIYLNRLQQVCA